ncbi:venom serine protease 34-like [Photinus pyralis]|uniref:venom serine protease 34-like n=1 Tax=Photinus pyralis TaxID=7054 RepID=UPI0012677A64|nr:venom serine protease 34-like [Photinus pyralis]
MMAGLVHLQKRKISCGATIIASRYAISAAHCGLNETVRTFGLLVGDDDINGRDDTPSAALYTIENILRHHMYNLGSKENDISIIKTEKIISFGSDVGPACLPFRFSNFDFNDQKVLALGWGTTTGPKLQKVNLTTICNNKRQEELPSEKIFSSVLCSYGAGKDACQFASGGPLLWYDSESKRLQLVGVISNHLGCGGDLPAVNTRVTSYLDWIISKTSDVDYCIK